MESDAQAIFYFIAFVCFVLATVFVAVSATRPTAQPWWKILVAAGLACWVFVNFWVAVQA